MKAYRLASALLLAGLFVPRSSFAQKEPRRPQLDASADSNDSYAYYLAGRLWLGKNPDKSADAFFWAAKLDPTMADAYYGRRIALLLQDKKRLLRYWDEDKSTLRSREVQYADSLYLYALTLNPFLPRSLDGVFFEEIMHQIAIAETDGSDVSPNEMQYEIDRYLSDAPSSFRAWKAYIDGDFDGALSLYESAIGQGGKNRGELYEERARLLYQMGRVQEALPDMTAAVAELRKTDRKNLVYLYQSKALAEESLGMIHSRLGQMADARESFATALEEDLSYYPAHVQLAYLALDAKDTPSALNELDLAVQIRPGDVVLRYAYGYTLAAAGKFAEAETQLRKAIELNPFYAASYYSLGEVLEAAKREPEAVAAYQQFLARSAQKDPRRAEAESRIKLGSAAQ